MKTWIKLMFTAAAIVATTVMVADRDYSVTVAVAEAPSIVAATTSTTAIRAAATVREPARRGTPLTTPTVPATAATTTTTTPAPVGLNGLPFAPAGLDECAEMLFYMQQFGLPSRFGDGGRHQRWTPSDGLGWRESKCKNYVNTWCCYGYWQLHINLFLKDWKLGPLLRNECKVNGVSDIFGHAPLQKQKQACAARKLYDVAGLAPWKPLS